MENTKREIPTEIRFHRTLGIRSCRIEAKPTVGGKWRMLIVGDYIPTVEDMVVGNLVPETEDKIVNEHELYVAAEKILADWAVIARERYRRQGFETKD